MKKLIIDTIRATCFKLDPLRLANSFEIFGYDFMLDDQFKLSLIEVNTNPCLEESSQLLKEMLPRMIEDMLKLTVDQIFPKHSLKRKKRPA